MTPLPTARRRAAAALLAAAAFAGPPAAAAAPPPPAPAPAIAGETAEPSFAIESIRVEGVRPRSEAVVAAASLLEPGGTYSERELRDAVSRVVRLPFVLSAEFALERGSERGEHVLVIRAVETRRFFFATDYRRTFYDRTVSLENAAGSRDSRFFGATAGYRHPLATYGEAFVAFDTEQGVQVGLAHYNLFGRGATGSVAYAGGLCCPAAIFPLALDPGLGHWSLSDTEQAAARLALPLGGNHGLRFTAELARSENGSRGGVLTPLDEDFALVPSLEHRRVEAAWVYDDSDDPLAPRSGRTWTAGLDVQDLDGTSVPFDVTGGSGAFGRGDPVAVRGEMARLFATGVVHRPLTARQSVSVGARLAAARGRTEGVLLTGGPLPAEDRDGVEASLSATHRLILREPPEEFTSVWLETEAGYAHEELSPAAPGTVSALGQARIGLSLVFRNAWGVYRFGVAWVGVEEDRP